MTDDLSQIILDIALVGRLRRHRLPKGECMTCDRNRADRMLPYHEASKFCERSKRTHCSCARCY